MEKEWLDTLQQRIKQKYVRVAKHPDLPLWIYNYTAKAQSEGVWDEITTVCRGLVLDDKGKVIVNCPPKFFNQGDFHATDIDPYSPRTKIMEKLDGYYISITNSTEYGIIITSRGSFTTQYVEATKYLVTLRDIAELQPDTSYFCELCQTFPGDERAIVTQHKTPKLVCWAVRDQDGFELENPSPFSEIGVMDTEDMEEYLKQEVEGVVLYNSLARVI